MQRPLEVKICGMRDPRNIAEVAACGPDYLGFLFYAGSKRFVGTSFDPRCLESLGEKTRRVGVFVDAEASWIVEQVRRYRLDVVQLHGVEDAAFCGRLRDLWGEAARIWKAVGISEHTEWRALSAYVGRIERFLFDTQTQGWGGAGRRFDWSLLANYPLEVPYLLAGGLDRQALSEVFALGVRDPRLVGVDFNSRLETAVAQKSVAWVAEVISEVRGEL